MPANTFVICSPSITNDDNSFKLEEILFHDSMLHTFRFFSFEN